MVWDISDIWKRRVGVESRPSDFQDEVEEIAVGTTPARLSHE